jgi:hypothetical protein
MMSRMLYKVGRPADRQAGWQAGADTSCSHSFEPTRAFSLAFQSTQFRKHIASRPVSVRLKDKVVFVVGKTELLKLGVSYVNRAIKMLMIEEGEFCIPSQSRQRQSLSSLSFSLSCSSSLSLSLSLSLFLSFSLFISLHSFCVTKLVTSPPRKPLNQKVNSSSCLQQLFLPRSSYCKISVTPRAKLKYLPTQHANTSFALSARKCARNGFLV